MLRQCVHSVRMPPKAGVAPRALVALYIVRGFFTGESPSAPATPSEGAPFPALVNVRGAFSVGNPGQVTARNPLGMLWPVLWIGLG